MEMSLIIQILSGLVTALILVLVASARKSIQDVKNTVTELDKTAVKVDANYDNFKKLCDDTSVGLKLRVDKHGDQIDVLNETVAVQKAKLETVELTVSYIKKKVYNGTRS